MKAIIILLLIASLSLPVQAERGIILNASDYVQYKYDTPEPPTLQPGEYIIPYEDINSVLRGAKYDGVTFVNPEPSLPLPEEEVIITVEQNPLDPTQTIISGLTGAGTAYLVARRKKA